jgi:hypothetical protein
MRAWYTPGQEMAGLWRLDVHYMTMGVAFQTQSSERPVKWAKKFSFGVSSLQHGGSMARDIIAGIILITIIIVISAGLYELMGFIFK